MTFVLSGFLGSFVIVVFLAVLFHYEGIAGRRFGERWRVRADFYILKIKYTLHKSYRHISNHLLRQIFRYLYHMVLRLTLLCVTRVEKWLRENIHANRSLAKYADRESATKSKLEELTLHKAEIALTEEEKKIHRERSLEGM